VAREVNQPRTPLQKWLAENSDRIARFLPEEGSLYLEFLRQPQIHDGEAAAIAIALNRRGALVTNDQAAGAKADAHGVSAMGTQQFLNSALL